MYKVKTFCSNTAPLYYLLDEMRSKIFPTCCREAEKFQISAQIKILILHFNIIFLLDERKFLSARIYSLQIMRKVFLRNLVNGKIRKCFHHDKREFHSRFFAQFEFLSYGVTQTTLCALSFVQIIQQ